jgi:hypothetical protein
MTRLGKQRSNADGEFARTSRRGDMARMRLSTSCPSLSRLRLIVRAINSAQQSACSARPVPRRNRSRDAGEMKRPRMAAQHRKSYRRNRGGRAQGEDRARDSRRLDPLHVLDFASRARRPGALIPCLAGPYVDSRFQEARSALLERMRRIFCYWRFLGPEQSIAGQIRAPQHKSAGDQREPELVLSGKKKAMEGLNGAQPARSRSMHSTSLLRAHQICAWPRLPDKDRRYKAYWLSVSCRPSTSREPQSEREHPPRYGTRTCEPGTVVGHQPY